MAKYKIDLMDYIEIELIKRNKTKREFFKDLKLSSRTYYEMRSKKPTMKTLHRIAGYLDIDIQKLLDKLDTMNYEEGVNKRKDD